MTDVTLQGAGEFFEPGEKDYAEWAKSLTDEQLLSAYEAEIEVLDMNQARLGAIAYEISLRNL